MTAKITKLEISVVLIMYMQVKADMIYEMKRFLRGT